MTDEQKATTVREFLAGQNLQIIANHLSLEYVDDRVLQQVIREYIRSLIEAGKEKVEVAKIATTSPVTHLASILQRDNGDWTVFCTCGWQDRGELQNGLLWAREALIKHLDSLPEAVARRQEAEDTAQRIKNEFGGKE